MTIKVCIQAGHVSAENNIIPSLRRNTGAPEERANNLRIANLLCQKLRDRGIEVYQADACANSDPKVIKTDFNLFLSLHCDADIPNDGGSGFADYADPSIDSVTKESQRICTVINNSYFPETGINYKNGSNINTRKYYMWQYLTAKTPCVLLEMGQSVDPHDKVLLGNRELIAGAIFRSVCMALGVSYETPKITITKVDEKDKKINELNTTIDTLNRQIKQAQIDFDKALSDKDIDCQNKTKTYKEKIINFINSL